MRGAETGKVIDAEAASDAAADGWRRFLAVLAGALSVAAVLVAAALLVLDPYGVSPVGLPKPRPLMDVNQRYMYPQVIRHGGHDSLVVGTSTSRLLRPVDLEATFGGRFANLALNDGRAWEQWRIVETFVAERGRPRTLIVGLDGVWCAPDADEVRTTERGWPEWLWADGSAAALAHTLDRRSLELAGRQIGLALGLEEARYDGDGWGDFTPGDAAWSLDRARENLWGDRERIVWPIDPPYKATADDRAAWHFPALRWLDAAIEPLAGRSTVVLAFMPVHVTAQPQPGSREAAREAACKEAVRAIAERHGATYVDFRVPSDITRDDTLWWDPLHWRIGLGPELIAAMADARR